MNVDFKKLTGFFLAMLFLAEFSTLTIGCKPKIVEAPVAAPTATPIPPLGNLIFCAGRPFG